MNEQKHRKIIDEVDADIEFWSEELDFVGDMMQRDRNA